MQVDDALLKRLEKLSFLTIDDEKREEIIAQLSGIVEFVDNLSELNTENVDENFALSDSGTPTREDKSVCDSAINDDILKNAPRSEEHFFIVPKIIE
ncbi:MAG: Asp-tRNA(Asn)/Glu-tRNA(Gln) amidotransferase subunit GatC [Helicobacteraceae bacterium]|jgi:aspartyl-tRNA(Asn)/glutamyl-tRNA(Gln) amidotransferase subunit C|nr:Asp-tRNA(Asn)/Glu-tRNA(Gln) amidotransferase subunit GatC [Helicobacteraceae bacterium]